MNLNHIYAVRVRAENTFGVSDPSQPVTSRLLSRGDERGKDDEEPMSKTKRLPTSALDEYGKLSNEYLEFLLFIYEFYLIVGTRPSLQVDGPDIQYFLEGQNVRITMLLVGYPVPDLTWYHDVSLQQCFI